MRTLTGDTTVIISEGVRLRVGMQEDLRVLMSNSDRVEIPDFWYID